MKVHPHSHTDYFETIIIHPSGTNNEIEDGPKLINVVGRQIKSWYTSFIKILNVNSFLFLMMFLNFQIPLFPI